MCVWGGGRSFECVCKCGGGGGVGVEVLVSARLFSTTVKLNKAGFVFQSKSGA